MPPNVFKAACGTLVVILAVVVLASGGGSGEFAVGEPPGGTPPGHYPPAPSKAEGMTPEWRAFADAVDRICALTFNHAMALRAQLRQTASMRGWSEARAESEAIGIWAEQTGAIVSETRRLGRPPRRVALFRRWRGNVARRSDLFSAASAAAARGRFAEAVRISRRQIRPLKRRANELGQRFGLRICTSNGPRA